MHLHHIIVVRLPQIPHLNIIRSTFDLRLVRHPGVAVSHPCAVGISRNCPPRVPTVERCFLTDRLLKDRQVQTRQPSPIVSMVLTAPSPLNSMSRTELFWLPGINIISSAQNPQLSCRLSSGYSPGHPIATENLPATYSRDIIVDGLVK